MMSSPKQINCYVMPEYKEKLETLKHTLKCVNIGETLQKLIDQASGDITICEGTIRIKKDLAIKNNIDKSIDLNASEDDDWIIITRKV